VLENPTIVVVVSRRFLVVAIGRDAASATENGEIYFAFVRRV
jgi:hypothetical protein